MKIKPEIKREILHTEQKKGIDWDEIEDTENYIYDEESDLAAKALERLSIIKSTVLWLSKLTKPQRKVVELKILSNIPPSAVASPVKATASR